MRPAEEAKGDSSDSGGIMTGGGTPRARRGSSFGIPEKVDWGEVQEISSWSRENDGTKLRDEAVASGGYGED